MSLILNKFHLVGSILRTNVIPVRFIHSVPSRLQNKNKIKETTVIEAGQISVDRSKIISVETSIKYLKSKAYKKTYGNDPVWKIYTRNFKGQYMPRKTRKTCIRNNVISTGSPCPICRDEYLILHYRNIDLLKQFISDHNGEIISYNKTGICQKAHNNLLVAVLQAKEYGLLVYDVPFRRYEYSEWQTDESNI